MGQALRRTKDELGRTLQRTRTGLGQALRQTRTGLRRVARRMPGSTLLWATSSVALGTAEIAHISGKTTPFLGVMRGAGLLGSAGLTLTSLYDLRRARTLEGRMDAAGDLAWGTQGLLYLSAPSSTLMGGLSQGVGILGGACQTAVGCRRIYRGIKQRDRSMIKLGALDLAGGLFWLGWDLMGWENPLFIGSFVGLMIGREAYANRDAIKAWGKRVGTRVSCLYGKCRRKAAEVAKRTARGTQNLLRSLARGLGPRTTRDRGNHVVPDRR